MSYCLLVLFTTVLVTVPAVFAETPSPALLVLNKEGSLALIDPGSGQVVGKVPTGADPHEVAVSSDGKLAFTSNYGAGRSGNEGHTISVIDISPKRNSTGLT